MPKIKPQILSRPPLERMMRFHNLIKEDSFPNCTKLAQEFEVTVRTVMRDLDFMRDRLLLPIEFDSQRNGFHYTEPVDQFPQMPFSEAEIFAGTACRATLNKMPTQVSIASRFEPP